MSIRMRQERSMKTTQVNGSQRVKNISVGKMNQTRFFGYTVFQDVAKLFSGKAPSSTLIQVPTKQKKAPKSLNRLASTVKNSPKIEFLLTSTSHSEIRRSRRLLTC